MKTLKQTNANCPASSVQVQSPRRQSKWNQRDYGENDLWNRWLHVWSKMAERNEKNDFAYSYTTC